MNRTRDLPAALAAVSLAALAARGATRYVAQAGQTPEWPYTNGWASAASNIQDAVDAAVAGETVLVGDGVYDTGGVTNYPSGSLLTNRVAIYKAITVRSANNDPVTAIIKGAWDPNTNGPAAVRCVYMVNKSSLIGFTLTHGATLAAGQKDGGGLYGYSKTGHTVSNCVIAGNRAARYGGGAFNGGVMYDCTITDNAITPFGGNGGGVMYGTLYRCKVQRNTGEWGGGVYEATVYDGLIVSNSGRYGGGVYGGSLYNCKILYNTASPSGGNYGGGAARVNLYNCLVAGNYAGNYGGAVYGDSFYNTTIVGNRAGYDGAAIGKYYNCIVYYNTPKNMSSTYVQNLTNSCTYPRQANWAEGDGNITNAPAFIDPGSGYGLAHVPGDYHLGKGSPCIDAGTNMAWITSATLDLDGAPRIRNGVVDMGAYEFQPVKPRGSAIVVR